MATRLLKCYGSCEKKYPQEELEKLGGKNYCSACATAKKKIDGPRKRFLDYINLKFGTIDGRMMKDVKRMMEENEYTYIDMYLCSSYCFDVKGMIPDMKYGLAFIVHYMTEAQNYASFVRTQREQASKIPDDISKPMEVTINMNDKSSSTIIKERKLFDMGEWD